MRSGEVLFESRTQTFSLALDGTPDFTGLDRGARKNHARHLVPVQGRDGDGHREVGLSGASRSAGDHGVAICDR